VKVSRHFVSTAVVAALLTPVVAQARSEAPPGDFQGAVVSVGQCAFAVPRAEVIPQPPANLDKALLPVIAAGLITQLVNKVGTALSNAGEAKTWPTQAGRNFERKDKKLPQCLQLVRASFFNQPSTQIGWNGELEKARAALAANGTFPAASPDYFFEGEIVASSDSTAFALRPVVSFMAKPAGARALRSGADRVVAMFLSITKPGDSPALATAPGATLKLGSHRPGVMKYYPTVADGAAFSGPYDSAWFVLPKDYIGQPLTMNLLQTETQGESQFLRFFGTVLSDKSVTDEAGKQLQQTFIPSVGTAAAVAAQSTLNTQRNTAETARATALDKLDACIANPAKAAEAKQALRAFVAADSALEQGDPAKLGNVTYALIETIKVADPNANILTACTNLRNNYLATP